MTRTILLFLLASFGCATPRTQINQQDLFLPQGDAARGREAFVKLKCTSCHQVVGADLPTAVTDGARVSLGGKLRSRPTDSRMVTAIIHPDQRVSQPWVEGVTAEDGSSRMPSFAEAMTVSELIDIVAFLRRHQTYE